jgi:hypothetical protein
MKNITTTSLRAAALAAALLLVPAIASAKDNTPSDLAAQLLATSGRVPVKAAGPYVEVGSYRIHVSAHLGRPNAVLADGTWMYHNFTADESAASGTLMVRFDHGRVSELALISHTVETALLKTPTKANGAIQIASK